MPRYFLGCPHPYKRDFFAQIGCAVFCLPFVAASVFCLHFYGTGLRGHFHVGGLLAVLFSAFAILWFGMGVAFWMWSKPQVLPFFEKRLGDASTWLNGYVVSRNCRALDLAAARHGVLPVSAFGFPDPPRLAETITWHAAEEGLRTVRALLREIAARPQAFRKPRELAGELQLIEDALSKAHSRGVRFCFRFRSSGATCAAEHDETIGSYF